MTKEEQGFLIWKRLPAQFNMAPLIQAGIVSSNLRQIDYAAVADWFNAEHQRKYQREIQLHLSTSKPTRWSLVLAFITLLASCATPPPPEIIVKHDLAPPPKPVIPDDPLAGLSPQVRAAIASGSTQTLHNGIQTIWPYDPNTEYTLYLAPLRATEIRLGPGEYTDKDWVVMGDVTRWTYRVTEASVMVEPLGTPQDVAMQTNMVIRSNKHVYNLLLKLRSKPMLAVGWYYINDVKAAQVARSAAIEEARNESH